MTQQTPPVRSLAIGVALLMGVTGCDGGSDGSDTRFQIETGRMSLAVTDAPVDQATRVVVRFTHVELKPADDGERIRINLDETIGEINLLALQGEDHAFLFEDEELPAGEYDWIRFYLEADPAVTAPPLSNMATTSFIEFEDGTTSNLIIPGGLQAGLQLVSGFTVPANGSVAYTVDFDLRQAIRPASGAPFEGYHRMRRALRMVDNAEIGAITGTVDPMYFWEHGITCHEQPGKDYHVCPGAAVYVFEGSDREPTDIQGAEGDPVTTANVRYQYVEDTGNWEHRYTAGFLKEGSYTVALTLEASQDDPEKGSPIDFVDQANAEVVAGERTHVNF